MDYGRTSIGVELITLVESNFRVCAEFAAAYLSGTVAELPDTTYEFEFSDEHFEENGQRGIIQLLGVKVLFLDDEDRVIADDRKRPFELSATLAGRFRVSQGADAVQAKALESTASAIVFPYLRELVSNLTMRTVYPTLRMPPINVIEARRARAAAQEANGESSDPASQS